MSRPASYFKSASIMLLPAIAITSSGCSLTIPRSYVEPREVTLEQAMRDLACGLKTLQNEQSRIGLNMGTVVDQVDITLNLTASAKGTSGLVVNAAPTLPATVGTLGLAYSDTTAIEGTRGNTIKITLKGLGTADLNEAGEKALERRGFRYDLGPSYYAYLDNPCEPVTFSPEQEQSAYRQ